jgi:CheY-like chemotaxis protein
VLASGLEVLSLRRQDTGDVKTFDSMRRAIDRGATLTQQLLAFARQQPLVAERRNVNHLISGFESVLRRAGDGSIEFQVELDPQLHSAVLDSARFESALLNLVVNARDAMPLGGRLHIATRNVDLAEREVGTLAAGPYVRVTVSDTGTGMSPETIRRAFEPFYTTKEVGKGTGLGLSQVYGFIKQSGGEVIIASSLGEGTVISIYLPAVTEGADIVPRSDTDVVLIVEDEPDLMDVATALFINMGYDVLTAASGREALKLLEKHHVDILFTDVVMPNGMNGIELATCAREKWPQMNIILVSGYPLPALKADGVELGHFVFVTKPYRLADLARALRKVA